MSQSIDGIRVEQHSDADLLKLIREKKESHAGRAAAAELFGRYQDPVYQWCFRRVRDHDRAMDLAQDVLLNAYRKITSFDGRARFSSWLFAIMRNRCLNALRRPPLLDEEALDPEHLADPQKRQDQELEEREEEERILELIREHLDPLDQEVIWMRCFEKMPVDAITVALRITDTSGARGALQRARRRLRTVLAVRDSKRESEEGKDQI